MKNLIVFISLLFLPFWATSQNLYFPPTTGNTWDTLAPSSLGYCQTEIDSLYDFLEQENSKAFILIKDGKIVLEKYFGTFEQDSVWYWASAGKTLMATLVGIAQQEGHLSIQDTTSQYLGQGWTNCTPSQEEKITIWHQLTMTSGLDDGVSNPDCTADTCLNYLADAGTRWAYHNGPYTLLKDVMETATGANINLYVSSRLGNTTGFSGLYFPTGDNNVFYSKARSMARLGLLLLANGQWNGTAVISDTAYLNGLSSTSQNLNEAYGYLTWLNGTASYMIPQTQFVFTGQMNPQAPSDMYAAMGKNGQLINVVPSQNLVWIRMGNQPTAGGRLISPIFNNEVWKRLNQLVCLPTSTQSVEVAPSLRLSPNPTQGQVHVETSQPVQQASLHNTLGQSFWVKQPNAKRWTVDLSTLPKGMYLLRLQLANGQEITKPIVRQ